MEATTDEPLDSADVMQATIAASGALAMPINIAVNLLDERASYNKLVQGLSIYNNSSQEQRAHMRTRLGDQIHALLSCPPASHAEVIESILVCGICYFTLHSRVLFAANFTEESRRMIGSHADDTFQ